MLAGGVAAALALLPSGANAALGGANALTTALRPDLRTATVQSTNAVDDTTTVRVCFSKAIASLPQAARFRIGAYYAQGGSPQITATSATRSTSNCADAVFPNSDATSFTFVSVDGSTGTAPDGGTSAVSTNGFGNIQDSTALIGSNNHNGTRGFGINPDLIGITVNNAAATIDYTFDQRIGGITATGLLAGTFVYNLADGTPVPSLAGAGNRALSTDGLTVRVNFPPGPQIQGAVRAFVLNNAVVSKSGSFFSDLRSASRPGNGGFTDRPDLIAVTLGSGGTFIDYQFDQVLTAIPGGAAAFLVGYSQGGQFHPAGTTVSIVGGAGVGNTVRLTDFGPAFLLLHEHTIDGAATAGAVTGAGGLSTAGGLPTGGNVGAFSTGFTSASEALKVSFDNATDVAHVLFDQRWTAADNTKFKLIDDQGSQISAGAINVSGTGATAAGQTTADVTFPAGTLAGARSLLLQAGAVTSSAGPEALIQQVISPTAPAAKTAKRFRPIKVVRRSAKRGH
jgi:hypothetical protein